MDDQPPPRKRSRFFVNGKSKIGDILQPFRKAAEQEQLNQDQPTTTGDNSSTVYSGAARTIPQAGFPSQTPSLTGPSTAQASSHQQDAQTESAHIPPSSGHHSRRPSTPASEEETDIESDHDNEQQPNRDGSDEENSTPVNNSSATGAVSRAHRRRGIHGVDELHLGSATASTNGYTSIFGANRPRSDVATNTPLLEQGLNTARQPFTFRADPVLSAFPPGQSVPPKPGHGLAQMKGQLAHRDTGPLSRTARVLPGPVAASRVQGYVDTDRDAHGRLLPNRQRYESSTPIARPINLPNIGITNMPYSSRMRSSIHSTPLHIRDPDSTVPDNLYSWPGRIEHAKRWAKISRKRKRPDAILPPPSYVYKRTNSTTFNILDAILLYPELVFHFATILPVGDLINLYCISRDFHTIVDTRFTTILLGQALSKAPESARAFQFRCYNHLCRKDPAARIRHPDARKAQRNIPRRIPSFRWLKMVLYREKVVHELVTVFAEEGVPMPDRCRLAIKRLWFLMDIPDNSRRIGFVHNRMFLGDTDLYFAACFFIKLDMLLHDPTSGEKCDGMRKLLMSQRSMSTVLRVIKRDIWTTRYDLMREYVKCRYQPAADERGLPMFGIPAERVGKGRYEFWGLYSAAALQRNPEMLLRPDQLVVREAFRRGIEFDKYYIRFLLHGYVDETTLDNHPPKDYGRRITDLRDTEYNIDDTIGGVAALDLDDPGHDPLLDLGKARKGSIFTVVKDAVTDEERKLRKESQKLAAMCRSWWSAQLKLEAARQKTAM